MRVSLLAVVSALLRTVSHATVDHKPAIAPRNVTSIASGFSPSEHFPSRPYKQTTQPTMADNDVATRAPESDAQEDLKDVEAAKGISGIPGDSKPDQGSASMGVSVRKERH